MWDPGRRLEEHAAVYETAHGRHPYTDAWPWAEAIVSWRARHAGRTWRPVPEAGEGDRELVVAGVAECIRLEMAPAHAMGRRLGDLGLDHLQHNAVLWVAGLRGPADPEFPDPEPGDPQWPAPTGPYAQQWHALMATVPGYTPVAKSVIEILAALAQYGCERPHVPAGVGARRLREHGVDSVSLAEVAPSLGMSPAPVAVGSSRWYEGVTGLRVLETAV
ncbi:hypothetical protein [Streptomyces armeniacus]|nr:hypothetical protein [Streptomyces armeniacus]